MASDSLIFFNGVRDFADACDVFLLDLWGVIHDGETPYPGAIDALRSLKAAGKRTVLLSNAPRLGAAAAQAMEAMGIGSDLYDAILTSGDVVNDALRRRVDPDFKKLGDLCVFLGPERDWNILDGTDVSRTDEPAAASFVLNTGPASLDETEEDYQAFLDTCLQSALPMVCANPDVAVIRGGKRVMCAGALAAVYTKLGGTVIYRGKPDVHIFKQAVARIDAGAAARVVMIGDGLLTDIPGALKAGFDAVFVTGGLNAEALGVVHGQRAEPDKVRTLLAQNRLKPQGVLPAFVW